VPSLKTSMHLDMWREYGQQRSFLNRVRQAMRDVLTPKELYGLQWGDPEIAAPLGFIRDRYVLPYVKPDRVAVEIGPGGGRWTRYLLGCGQLYVVDYHPELLNELRKTFNKPIMQFIKNNGSDFPGIPENSVDFIFSFACFVHLDADLIEAYLKNMKSILKPGGNVVIHYSDKTKIMAQINPGFSENTPERMRSMVSAAGFQVVEEDLTTMWHSSLIRFTH